MTSRTSAAHAMTTEDAVAFAVEDRLPSQAKMVVKPKSEIRLTKRELEIAGLIAHEMTSRDIATKLFISERTVEAHVTNMLNKLGSELSGRTHTLVDQRWRHGAGHARGLRIRDGATPKTEWRSGVLAIRSLPVRDANGGLSDRPVVVHRREAPMAAATRCSFPSVLVLQCALKRRNRGGRLGRPISGEQLQPSGRG